MKKSLLVTLLLALLMPWALRADEVVIGDEAATTTEYTVPVNMYYHYSLVQQIYLADEIGTAGSISAISFDYTNSSAFSMDNIQVFMVNTDKAEFASTTDMEAISDGDKVYEGTFSADAAGWVTITLDLPFQYDGTSNLLICFYDPENGYPGSAFKFGTTAVADGTYLGLAYYSDSYTPSLADVSTFSGSKSRYTYRNTIMLEITPDGGVACEKPSTLDVAEITIHGASLGWADGSGVYNLEYKKRTDEDWTSLLSATGDFSYDLTDLDPFTAYQVRVQSVCDDTVSGWKSANFTTLAGVPFIENFDAASIPTGWSRATGLLDNIIGGTATLTPATSGWNFGERYVFDSHAYVNIWGTDCNKWLVMPEMFIEENTQLTFDLALTDYNNADPIEDPTAQTDDRFIVLASMDGGESWEVLRQWDNQGSEDVFNEITNASAGQAVVIDLSGYADQNITLAFYGESTASGGDNDLHIDNVRVDFVPLCERPMNLAVIEGSATETSIDLEWTDDAASTWLLQYKKSGVEEWTSLAEEVTENPFTLEGLDASSTYQVRIAAWCDPSDSATISQFSNPISFATECGVVLVDAEHPFEDNFESYPSGAFAAHCWVNEHIAGTSTSVFNITTSAQGGNSSHMLQLPDQADGNMVKLVLPAMDLQAGDNYQFVLDVYRSNSTYSPGNNPYEGIRIFVSLDGEIDGATELAFIPRQYDEANGDIPAEPAAAWYTYELPLGVDGECYIILRGESKYCTATYMDNFKVNVMPTCFKPNMLAVDSIAVDAAVLDWNATGDEDAWLVQYKLAADSMWISVEDPVTEKPYELADLMQATRYEVRVAAWCDVTDPAEISEFSNSVVFATSCMALAVDEENSYLEDFNIYEAVTSSTAPSDYPNNILPDCWSFLNMSASSSTYPQAFISSSSAYAVSGNCLFLTSSSTTPLYAILPEFDTDIAGLQLSFVYRNEGTGTSNGTLHVGYLTNPADASTYVDLGSFAQTTVKSQHEVSFVGAPAGSRMAFKYQGGSSNNYYLSIDSVVVSVLPSCVKPREIAVSEITSHTALLSWTPGAEETAWQIMLNNDAENLIEADTNSFVLTNLPADSLFIAKVRANCGDEYSEWSIDSVVFRTLVACPAPVFRADSVQNILARSAELHWGGDAEGYIVSCRTAAGIIGVVESFEDGLDGWTMRNCYSSTGVTTSTAKAHSGSKSFRFYYSTNPPQYLISPEMDASVEGDALAFYYMAESSSYNETFKVGYSSTDNATASFTFGSEISTEDTDWHLFSEAIPVGTKFICIQYTADDQYYLYIDDIAIGTEIPAGDWVESNVTGNSLVLSNLEPETKYDVKIQGNCGDEGLSAETAILTFRTISNCQTPTAVEVLEIGLDSVVLSWNGYGLTEFNLRYSDDAENWIVMNDVTIPCVIRGLNPSTVYAVQVQATCDTEKWSIGYTFSTKDGIPFADADADGIVRDWYTYKTLASDVFDGQELANNGNWSVAAADDLFEGSHFKLNIYGGSCKDWLVSPSIDATNVQLAADEKLKLGFTMALAKWNGSGSLATVADTTGIDDKFIVVFSIDDGETWSEANATVWDNAGSPNVFNDIPNTGVDILLDFSAGAGHVMRIAFYGESTVSNADNNIFIGNILLDVVGNTTGIDALENSTDAVKFFQDGKIYIRFNGVTYDAVGRIIRK